VRKTFYFFLASSFICTFCNVFCVFWRVGVNLLYIEFILYLVLNAYFCLVYWSCQFIARPSNTSLKHWQQMGGVKINEDIIIDKSIHKSINSRSAVLKVNIFLLLIYLFIGSDCDLFIGSIITQNPCSIWVHIIAFLYSISNDSCFV